MTDRVLAIIPIRGADEEFKRGPAPLLAGRPLLEYTLEAAKAAHKLDRIIVSTDSEAIAQASRQFGVEAPFLRPAALSAPDATLTDVLRHTVDWLAKSESYRPDWVMKLEITHPFRPKGMIDSLIETAIARQVDSAFLVFEEVHSFWTLDDNARPQQVGEGVDVPRGMRRPFYRDVSGLAAITKIENLNAGQFYGDNIGLIPCRNLFALVDTHERGESAGHMGWQLAELLAPLFARETAAVEFGINE